MLALTCAATLAPSSSNLLTNLALSALFLKTRGVAAPPIPTGGQARAHFLIVRGCTVRDGILGPGSMDSFFILSSFFFFNDESLEGVKRLEVAACA